jgi:hypothetical protein
MNVGSDYLSISAFDRSLTAVFMAIWRLEMAAFEEKWL